MVLRRPYEEGNGGVEAMQDLMDAYDPKAVAETIDEGFQVGGGGGGGGGGGDDISS